MIKKIMSGGQTGADRAALDVAMKYDIPHGGWIPRGRKTEAGPLSLRYKLKETPGGDYPSRTRQNIMDSDGTVIISRGPLTGGSLLTRTFARTGKKPNCHIDLSCGEAFEASMIIQSFILDNGIQALNVAGPRASHDPGIYHDVKTILEAVIYLLFLENGREKAVLQDLPGKVPEAAFPESAQGAAALLFNDLSLRIRAGMARSKDLRLMDIYFVWMEYVRQRVGLDAGNAPLLAACKPYDDLAFFCAEDAVMEILKVLYAMLKKTCCLRIVE